MARTAFLHGDTVDLCPINEEDVSFLNEHVNDPRIWAALGIDKPINDKQGQEWFEEHVSKDDSINFLVVVSDEPVGTISAFEIVERHGHATLGCWIAPANHGNGYGADATRTIISYLFDIQRLNAVTAHAHGANAASNGLLESIGMGHVGTYPEWWFHDGEYLDTNIWAVTAEEWREQTD